MHGKAFGSGRSRKSGSIFPEEDFFLQQQLLIFSPNFEPAFEAIVISLASCFIETRLHHFHVFSIIIKLILFLSFIVYAGNMKPKLSGLIGSHFSDHTSDSASRNAY